LLKKFNFKEKNIPMRKNKILSLLVLVLAVGSMTFAAFGQKAKAKTKPKPIIFAVLNDGKMIEPIAQVEKNKLTRAVGGDATTEKKKSFTDAFYKSKVLYRLIFGGKDNGAVKVESFNPNADCSSNMAQVRVSTRRVKLRGFVMGLATDMASKKPGSGVRRLPSAAERLEIDNLVKKEFAKNKIAKNAIAKRKYHNLTAIDVDNDGTAELVGTFYVPISAKERGLLFFIAQEGENGNYYFSYSEFSRMKDSDVMSGEISALDDGIYHELLLDVLDYDGDGVGEIFTITQGFEGNNFTVYKKDGKKWAKVFAGSNYHCGY